MGRIQGQIIDVKCKNRNKLAIFNFLKSLLNLSENWSFVTCITLGRIHEKRFKLSCPQVNVNPDANADADDAEIQLQ